MRHCPLKGIRENGFYDFLVYIKISVFTKTISMSCEMLCPKRQMLNWCVSWTNLISRRRKKTTVYWCNIFIKMIKPECVLPYNQTSIFALNQSIASLNYIHRTLNLSLSLSLKRTKTTPRFNSKQDNWFAYLYKCVCVEFIHGSKLAHPSSHTNFAHLFGHLCWLWFQEIHSSSTHKDWHSVEPGCVKHPVGTARQQWPTGNLSFNIKIKIQSKF